MYKPRQGGNQTTLCSRFQARHESFEAAVLLSLTPLVKALLLLILLLLLLTPVFGQILATADQIKKA